jgi:5-methylcytosine-specific restriction endonuclease McrA
MNKNTRTEIYNKYGGRCAYCGRKIELKDMQVDHIEPHRGLYVPELEEISNLNPACRRCNHYKRAHTLEMFRMMLKTIHERIRQIYICKVAEDYGIMEIKEFDGKFYFEREE